MSRKADIWDQTRVSSLQLCGVLESVTHSLVLKTTLGLGNVLLTQAPHNIEVSPIPSLSGLTQSLHLDHTHYLTTVKPYLLWIRRTMRDPRLRSESVSRNYTHTNKHTHQVPVNEMRSLPLSHTPSSSFLMASLSHPSSHPLDSFPVSVEIVHNVQSNLLSLLSNAITFIQSICCLLQLLCSS